jgi:hypothetical protein
VTARYPEPRGSRTEGTGRDSFTRSREGFAPKVLGRVAQGKRAERAPPWVERASIILHAEGVRLS